MYQIFYNEFKKKERKIVHKMVQTAKNVVQVRTKKFGPN